jgi:single-stranded-DNA-specific exonuclease
LAARAGGFALVGQSALADAPQLADAFDHVVALDPPTLAAADEAVRRGRGFTHLAWGESEIRFAEQMHELEYALRASLIALYRSLRLRPRVAGGDLEQVLRGPHRHGRPPRLAGRLLRVLGELSLVSLDRARPALALGDAHPTELDRSGAYRVYSELYEDGLRFLNRARAHPRS